MTRNIALDVLKVAMAVMVVALHADFLGDISALGSQLAGNGLFRIAVPVFLLINGFFFYPVATQGDYLPWLKKVATLYVVWMAIYSFYWFDVPSPSAESMAKLAVTIVFGYHHLWYLSGLLGAAVILLLIRRLSSPVLVMTILGAFVVGLGIQYAGKYHLFEHPVLDRLLNFPPLHRNALLMAYPFFCTGFLISKHKVHHTVTMTTLGAVSAIGILALLLESYVNFNLVGGGGFDIFASLLIVCPAIFLLFIKLEISGHSKNVALYATAIYFLHPLILDLLRSSTDLGGTVRTFVTLALCAPAAWLAIRANRRLKVLL